MLVDLPASDAEVHAGKWQPIGLKKFEQRQQAAMKRVVQRLKTEWQPACVAIVKQARPKFQLNFD